MPHGPWKRPPIRVHSTTLIVERVAIDDLPLVRARRRTKMLPGFTANHALNVMLSLRRLWWCEGCGCARHLFDPSMTATLATLPLDAILCISAFLSNPLDVLSLSQVRRTLDLRM